MSTTVAAAADSEGPKNPSPPKAPSPPAPSPHEIALAKSLRSHSLSLHKTFLSLDVDRDGYVTRSDLRAALHNALGVDLSREQMDAIFARFAYFEEDHRDEAPGDEGDGERASEGSGDAGCASGRRGSQASSTCSASGRRVHHGIRYAEFVRYIEATLLSSTSSSASYGSTLELASPRSEPYSPRPQLIAVKTPPDVTQKQLRQSLARIMRQRTKSGGSGGKGGKKAQLFLEMDTHRSGRVTVEEFREWSANNGLELDDEQARSVLVEHYDPDRGIDFIEFSRNIEELDGGGDPMPWEVQEDGADAAQRRAGLEAGTRAQAEADDIARKRVEEALRACVDDAMSDRQLVQNLSEQIWTKRTRLIDAFKKFDKNKDGKLTAGELKAALGEAGMVVSEERAESLVKKFDRDGDGRLNRGDFVRLISSGGAEEDEAEERGEDTVEKTPAEAAPEVLAPAAELTGKAPAPPRRASASEEQRASLLASLKGHEDETKAARIVHKLDEDDITTILSFREALDAERVMMRKVFQDMDKDRTKDLDVNELRDGFERMGVSVSDTHLHHIMRRFDPQNTGRLRYYQFVKLLSANLDDH